MQERIAANLRLRLSVMCGDLISKDDEIAGALIVI